MIIDDIWYEIIPYYDCYDARELNKKIAGIYNKTYNHNPHVHGAYYNLSKITDYDMSANEFQMINKLMEEIELHNSSQSILLRQYKTKYLQSLEKYKNTKLTDLLKNFIRSLKLTKIIDHFDMMSYFYIYDIDSNITSIEIANRYTDDYITTCYFNVECDKFECNLEDCYNEPENYLEFIMIFTITDQIYTLFRCGFSLDLDDSNLLPESKKVFETYTETQLKSIKEYIDTFFHNEYDDLIDMINSLTT
jgi:hypothetical protein